MIINRIISFSLRQIDPKKFSEYTSKTEIGHKKDILEYLQSFEDCAFTSEPVRDIITNEIVRDADNAKTDGKFTWYWSEIYHFEKYNIRLKDEFIKHVLYSKNIIMNNISLSFRISVNETAEKIISCMNNRYEIYKRTATTYFMSGNIIEIYSNDDYDKPLSDNDEDSYLYYRTYMDFFPTGESTLISQIALAKNIKHFFDVLGWKSEIISEFEMLI